MKTRCCFVALIAVGLLGCDRSGGQPSSAVSTEARGNSQSSAPQVPANASDYLVSATGMGGIELGMTLDQARSAIPSAKFERTSDGEGVALVEVTLAPGSSMILWAEEDDPAQPIDWSKKVRMIETFSRTFRTPEGVHPGSLVVDVEKLYGNTKEILKSEIESREYIIFEKQPAGLTFRLDYTGVFPDGSNTTTEAAPEGMIQSIAVSSST